MLIYCAILHNCRKPQIPGEVLVQRICRHPVAPGHKCFVQIAQARKVAMPQCRQNSFIDGSKGFEEYFSHGLVVVI